MAEEVQPGILEQYGMSDEEVEAKEAEFDKAQELDRKRREEAIKKSPLISKLFVDGKEYRKFDSIKMRDGKYLKVALRPLGDSDIYKAFDDVGIKEIPSSTRSVDIPPIKFARLATQLAIEAIDSDLTERELVESVEFGELTRIGTDIMGRLFKKEYMEGGKDRDIDMAAGFT